MPCLPPFWGEASPTQKDSRKKVTLILTSLLEDLVGDAKGSPVQPHPPRRAKASSSCPRRVSRLSTWTCATTRRAACPDQKADMNKGACVKTRFDPKTWFPFWFPSAHVAFGPGFFREAHRLGENWAILSLSQNRVPPKLVVSCRPRFDATPTRASKRHACLPGGGWQATTATWKSGRTS